MTLPGAPRTVGQGPITSAQLPKVPSQISRGNRVIALGDSITAMSHWRMATIFSKSRIVYAGNAGVGGDTITQVAARVDSDVLALSPRPARCVVLAGTNDIGNLGVTTDVLAARLELVWKSLIAGGVEPVACTIPPRDSVDPARTQAFNLNLTQRAARLGLTLVDFYSLLVDPSTGDYVAGYASDGTHPTALGQRVMGQLLADTLGPLLPAFRPYLTSEITDAANILTNGVFVGDANADGIANSWALSAQTGAATPSLVADATIKGNWQRLTVTAAGNRYFTQIVSMAGGNFAVGDTLAFSGRVRTSNLEANGMGVTMRVTYYQSDNTSIPPPQPVLESFVADITDGVFYSESVVPSAAGKVQVLLANGSNGLGTGTIDFAQITLVNLTKLGLG